MRSPSVSERLIWRAAAIAAIVTSGRTAHADDKQACSDAYAATQTLRKDGKLQAAHDAALACVREVCPEFIRTDCATWLGEVEASQPTLVLDVRDRAGAAVLRGTVELDGKPWLAAIDLQAHAIDPGTHVLRIVGEAGATVDQEVIVREGEKNIKVTATLPIGSAVAEPPPSATTAPPGDDEARSGGSLAPWILGGVGLGTMAVGGVLGLVVVGEKATFDEHCSAETQRCDATGGEARDTGETLGPVSTILLVTGAAAMGVGVVLLVTEEPERPAATVRRIETGPVVGSTGAAWRVTGSF